jgi:hypothetical protein
VTNYGGSCHQSPRPVQPQTDAAARRHLPTARQPLQQSLVQLHERKPAFPSTASPSPAAHTHLSRCYWPRQPLHTSPCGQGLAALGFRLRFSQAFTPSGQGLAALGLRLRFSQAFTPYPLLHGTCNAPAEPASPSLRHLASTTLDRTAARDNAA